MGTATQRSLPRGEVTMLFTDIEGSTRLAHELGHAYGAVLVDHHRLLRAVWAAHDGVEVNTEGDAFFVAFGVARAAVQAAAAAQEALAGHAWSHGEPLKVRMGIHTGAVQVRDGDYWGVDVHYAARLCSAAQGGQVLLSASTQALVSDAPVDDLGEHALKDFPVPRKLFHLVAAGQRSDAFPTPRTLGATHTNLPSVSATRLVGRDRDLAEVCGRLRSDARLLTLTGIGGSGKTRLALACGSALLDSFADGVFLVALAPVTSTDEVAGAIAAALGSLPGDGLDPEPAIVERLAKRELLLILDNMEHLLGAAPLVARLVEAAPGLRVLVTSQAPLRVRAEIAMPLGSLELPAGGESDPAALAAVPSVELFVERARAVDPAFELRADVAGQVAEICRRLDGLPLALELAAARVRLGGPERLLQALERGIDALGRGARDLPERQRGLRAALDWTVSLLGPEERKLFAALGVFADAWTVEQLERMFGADFDIWEATAALLDFSLIRTRGDGRLTMAEPVRAYAGELLDQQGRRDDYSRRHALMLAEQAEVIGDEMLFDTRALTARAVELMEEFSAALRWSADHDPAVHRRLVAAVGLPFYFTGHLSTVSDAVVSLVAGRTGEDAEFARLLMAHAMVLISRKGSAESVATVAAAAALRKRLGDERGAIVSALVEAHFLSNYLGEDGCAQAAELLERVRGEPALQADPRLRSLHQGQVAINRVNAGALDEADAILAAITADPGRRDFFDMAAWSYWADCALLRGEYESAVERYIETMRRIRGTQLHNMLLQIYGIAGALAGLSHDEQAVELMAAIQAVGERDGGIELPEDMQPEVAGLMQTARGRLGDVEVADARRRGRERDFEDTVARTFAIAAELAAREVRTR